MNIVLELLEHRKRYDKVVCYLQANANQSTAVSTLTISNVFYLVESNPEAAKVAELLFKNLDIISVTALDVAWAFDNYRGKDLEDALQVATAIHCKAKHFITIDKNLAKKYSKDLSIILMQ